jgi:hypothetical protein
MTVQIYVSKDSQGRERGPEQTHEMAGVIDLLRRLWAAYHHLPQLYAVVVDLQHPASADFVVLTEHGLGILELKDYDGLVIINHDGTWYAGDRVVKGGSYPTPAIQVHKYAKQIRAVVLPSILPPSQKINTEEEIKFQTGVIFSHPEADLFTVKQQVRKVSHPKWVDPFSVLAPREIVKWVGSLRFQWDYGPKRNYEHLRLDVHMIETIIQEQFDAVPWKEVLPNMPDGSAYAYLKDIEGKTIYELERDTVSLGRSPDCDIIIPAQYGRVSRHHCQITWRLGKVGLEDLGSKHGTFVDGKKVPDKKTVIINHNQEICLGGDSQKNGTCLLVFVVPDRTAINIPPTQSATIKISK